MMLDMPEITQPGRKDGAEAGPSRRWILPWLVAGLSLYVLWMGGRLAGAHQHGRHWFFFAPWWTSTSVKFLALASLFSAAFFWAGVRLRRWLAWGLAALLLGGQAWCARAAWGIVGGTVPWSFDHPSFLFRLKEFGALFPFALGGYNPWWNAGTEHFVGVTSGAHGFGLLIWPLLKIWEPHVFYGAAIVFWFLFGFPWLGVAAVRSAGIRWEGALCAGLLMCGVSREVFMWAWHYGTVGAMTSAMMALPVVALGYRLAVLRRGGGGTALALGLATWLMCLWTPGVFIAAGLVPGWLWNARSGSWRSNRWLFAAGALALVLLAPWFWTTCFPCRGVVRYVGTPMELPEWSAIARVGADRLWVTLQEWNPVLLFFGLLGSLVAAPREMRRWMLPLFLVLGAITGWSREFKPMSQLERMAIPMAVVAVFPAAVLGGDLLAADAKGGGRRRWCAVLFAMAQGLLLALLLMGLIRVQRYYANHDHTGIRIRTLPVELRDFADWIHEEVPEDGRLGFTGPSVHSYGGGNIAYLPVLAGREMMADDYYGFPRGTIEYNYPPAVYRKDLDSVLFFSRTYGITHWVTAIPVAQEFMAAHPDAFERAKELDLSGRKVEVYRVKEPGPGTRFLEGAGHVTARENRLEVFCADPSAERAVIRYHWRDGLVCRTEGASIEPFAVDGNLRFIAVHPGGNARVEIGYRAHAAPVKPNFDGYFHH